MDPETPLVSHQYHIALVWTLRPLQLLINIILTPMWTPRPLHLHINIILTPVWTLRPLQPYINII